MMRDVEVYFDTRREEGVKYCERWVIWSGFVTIASDALTAHHYSLFRFLES